MLCNVVTSILVMILIISGLGVISNDSSNICAIKLSCKDNLHKCLSCRTLISRTNAKIIAGKQAG